MGCHSSKAASPPVSTPARTLLASDDGNTKSTKSIQNTAGSEVSPEAQAHSDVIEAAEAFPITSVPMRPPNQKASQDAEDIPSNPSKAEDVQFLHEDLLEPVGAPQTMQKPCSGEGLMTTSASAGGAMTTSRATDATLSNAEQKEEFQYSHEPSSRVHKSPQGWEEEGILFPHEGVRFLLQEFSDALNTMDPLPAWKWDNVSTWYEDYFYSVVHHHHDAEEKIYLPWIQGRVSVPAKISADHPGLLQTMDDLSAMLKKGAVAPAGERAELLADIQQVVAAFVEDMLEHLAEEEQIIPRLLREGRFTQEEEGVVVAQIIQSLGLDGNKKSLPPMLHAYARWAGTDQAELFVATKLPLPIQFLYRNFWVHDFQNRNIGLLASLAEGVDTNTFASKWFC